MTSPEIREDCLHVQRLTEAFLLRQLKSSESDYVRRHLATCAECFRGASESAAVIGTLRATAPAECVRRPDDGRIKMVFKKRRADRVLLSIVAASVLAVIVIIYRLPTIPTPHNASEEFAEYDADASLVLDLATARLEAVDYLVRSQNPDGSWNRIGGASDYDIGVTALSTLALMSQSRHTDGAISERAIDAALAGCRYLADLAPSTSWIGVRRTRDAGRNLEVAASRTLALVEASKLWPDRFKGVAAEAVQRLMEFQRADGTFDSVGKVAVAPRLGSVLAAQAIEKAHESGLRVRGLPAARARMSDSGHAAEVDLLAVSTAHLTPESLIRASMTRRDERARTSVSGLPINEDRRTALARLAQRWTDPDHVDDSAKHRPEKSEGAALKMASLLLAMNGG